MKTYIVFIFTLLSIICISCDKHLLYSENCDIYYSYLNKVKMIDSVYVFNPETFQQEVWIKKYYVIDNTSDICIDTIDDKNIRSFGKVNGDYFLVSDKRRIQF